MPVRLVRVERGSAPTDVQMHWSSIFAGSFLIIGFGLFFLLLGNAVGLNLTNSVSPTVGGALKFWSWIYMAATLVFSYFVGSYLCTRSARIDTPMSGILHGLTSWGLASAVALAIAAIVSIAFRTMLTGVGANAANWLVVCVIGIGAFASGIGGLLGKYSKHHVVSTTEAEKKIA